MDFALVTKTLLKELDDSEVVYAIIGGFALGLWGISRATQDIDFLVLSNDIARLESALGKFSYVRAFKSENVSHYVSDLKPYGQIDVLHARRRLSEGMLARRVFLPFMGEHRLPTLEPEDIIGLKVQALSNQPSREARELDDMRLLLRRANEHGRDIDWQRLGVYFSLFKKEPLLSLLRKRYVQPD